RLIDLKNRFYDRGRFQLQFSIHSTEERRRDFLIPAKKWSFAEIARYGERFYHPGDRKLTLNFVLIQGYPVDPEVISYCFSPEFFLIKITPLNPTAQVIKNKLSSFFEPDDTSVCPELIEQFECRGYEVILSPGEPEENKIGSNCGQYVTSHETQELKKDLYETEKYII
ncbi:MAG: radical SAM protein, partial [candidate division Zixibacteria bacterium]|nr:radical SAM protein [candidate division Zixibacteria bacterium]